MALPDDKDNMQELEIVPQAWLKLEIKSGQKRAGMRWRGGSVADDWPSKLATLCDEDSVNMSISLGK